MSQRTLESQNIRTGKCFFSQRGVSTELPGTLRLHSGEASRSAGPWCVTGLLRPAISFIGPGFTNWLLITRLAINWQINSNVYIYILQGGYSISVNRILTFLIQCQSFWELALVIRSLLSSQRFQVKGSGWPWGILFLGQKCLMNYPCPATDTFLS